MLLLRLLFTSAAIHLLDDTLNTLLVTGLAVGNIVALDLVQRRRSGHLGCVGEIVKAGHRINWLPQKIACQ